MINSAYLLWLTPEAMTSFLLLVSVFKVNLSFWLPNHPKMTVPRRNVTIKEKKAALAEIPRQIKLRLTKILWVILILVLLFIKVKTS